MEQFEKIGLIAYSKTRTPRLKVRLGSNSKGGPFADRLD